MTDRAETDAVAVLIALDNAIAAVVRLHGIAVDQNPTPSPSQCAFFAYTTLCIDSALCFSICDGPKTTPRQGVFTANTTMPEMFETFKLELGQTRLLYEQYLDRLERSATAERFETVANTMIDFLVLLYLTCENGTSDVLGGMA